jgi:DNA-binding MarR family transcriptional regulator
MAQEDTSRGLGLAEAELTERVADTMKAASRSYVEALIKELSNAGFTDLTPSTTALLSLIPSTGAQAASLAQIAGKSKQAVAKLAQELEAEGYVQRVPDPNDKRGQLILLTGRGNGVVREGARIKAILGREAISLLGTERMERLNHDLQSLTQILSLRTLKDH